MSSLNPNSGFNGYSIKMVFTTNLDGLNNDFTTSWIPTSKFGEAWLSFLTTTEKQSDKIKKNPCDRKCLNNVK